LSAADNVGFDDTYFWEMLYAYWMLVIYNTLSVNDLVVDECLHCKPNLDYPRLLDLITIINTVWLTVYYKNSSSSDVVYRLHYCLLLKIWLKISYIAFRSKQLIKHRKSYGVLDLSPSPVFSGVRGARSSVLVQCFVDHHLSLCPFSFGPCIICPSIYNF
jgi:hypothetical protein